jgi:DNA-binding XRE family transcriptional regulator
MPEKVDKMKLSESQDRRRKLTEAQKEKIREIYKEGEYSQRHLAEKYGVSKSLIGIIVNPKRAEKVQERIKNHWKEYYDREKLTDAAKNTRDYKKELHKKGELK